MIKTFTIKEGQKPTKEQLLEVEKAAEKAIHYDEDSPELSPAMYKAFQCTVAKRSRERRA